MTHARAVVRRSFRAGRKTWGFAGRQAAAAARRVGAAAVRRPAAAAAAVGAGVLAVAFLAAAVGRSSAPTPEQRYAAAVRRVMEAERRVNREQEEHVVRALAAGADASETVNGANREIWSALSETDLRACPPDFQDVFLRHRDAVGDYLELSLQYDGFTGTLAGVAEMVATGRDPGERFRAADARIDELHLEMERVALRYGVQVGVK